MTNPVPDAPRAQAREIVKRIRERALCFSMGTDLGHHVLTDEQAVQVILEATAALRDEHARLTAERDAARAELAETRINLAMLRDGLSPTVIPSALAQAKAEGAREALEQAADYIETHRSTLLHVGGVIKWLRARAQERIDPL